MATVRTRSADMFSVTPDFQAYMYRDAICVEILTSNLMSPDVVRQFGRDAIALVQSAERPRLVIDFSNVEWMCSLMLGELVALAKSLSRRKGRLALASLRPTLRQLLEVVKLDAMMPVFDNVELVVWHVS